MGGNRGKHLWSQCKKGSNRCLLENTQECKNSASKKVKAGQTVADSLIPAQRQVDLAT